MTTPLKVFQFLPKVRLHILHSPVVGVGSDFLDKIIEQKLGFGVSDLLTKILRNISLDRRDHFLHLLFFQVHPYSWFKIWFE